jgi:DDE family transposase
LGAVGIERLLPVGHIVSGGLPACVFSSRGRSLPLILSDPLPHGKRFFRPTALQGVALALLLRLVAAFIHHQGRMSASQAAALLRCQARHRAALLRFLAQCRWSKDWAVLTQVADLLLQAEARRDGTWVFLRDQTYVGQQGQKTENTFSRANVRRRAKKGNRKNQKRAKRSGHGFVCGLLLTPSGLRIPCCRSYYTEAYCQAKRRPYRQQIELAAELVDALAVPPGAQVVVRGDTAFEAKDLRAACPRRQFLGVVPLNPERVFAGAKPRPKVASLAQELSAEHFQAVRLVPGQGPFAAQRRVARCRLGPKGKARTFYVHPGRRAVHHVGDVLLVFSTKEKPQAGQPVRVQKILMTNAVGLSAARVVELYDLRWQIELFFEECQGTLGLHQYRFREFVKVENWVQSCLVAFVYLEWYRARQLRRRGRSAAGRQWWGWQRSHGLCQAVRREVEEADLGQLQRGVKTKTGLKKLRRLLRAARPLEEREVA